MNAQMSLPDNVRLSVIIPALNEEQVIGTTLDRVRAESVWEVIVVDGGSADRTIDLARSCGATVISSARGRGVQMNAGAEIATGDVLLFLHADTLLPHGFGRQVVQTLSGSKVVAGAFTLRIDAPGLAFRVIEKAVHWRCLYLQLPYGDQGLFLRADTFRRVGRYREWPIMEDFELVRRLRREGRVDIAPGCVHTSARRWLEHGRWRTSAANMGCAMAYMFGISPERISRRRRAAPDPADCRQR